MSSKAVIYLRHEEPPEQRSARSSGQATDAVEYNQVELRSPAHRFDCIILANVLHLEHPEKAAALIQRVTPGLSAGGRLVIVDMFGEDSPEKVRSHAIYALHLALRTEYGSIHTLSQIQAWVREAGLIPADVIDFTMPYGLGALVAHSQ